MMTDLSKESNFISALFYLCDDEKECSELIARVGNVLQNNFKNYELVIVDDSRRTSDHAAIKAVSEKLSGLVSIVRMSQHFGVQDALNAAADIAIGDFIIEFEYSDLDFEDDLIMQAYRKALEGYDVVSAVPKGKSRTASKWFYNLYNKHSRGKYPLNTERFRIESRRAVNRVNAMTDSIVYRKALFRNCGLKCADVLYDPKQTGAGRKRDSGERFDLAFDSLLLFTDVASYCSMFISVAMMAFALFSLIYTVVIYLLGKPIEGWTTTMVFSSFAFFGLFAILTIIIKYLAVMLNLLFRKKSHLIESVEKLVNEQSR